MKTRLLGTSCLSLVIIISGLLLAPRASAQTKPGKKDGAGATVAKIGTYTLTLDEFERQFIKNNGGKEAALASTQKDREDFLDLLVKYRLKVLEARALGFEKDSAIRDELAEYRNSLAIPFLTERALIDPNVKRLYDRRQEEIRVGHILIRPVTDTLGAVNEDETRKKVETALADLNAGKPFDELAKKSADEEMTKNKGGDLYFFTAGMTVPAFDDAAYSLKKGEVYPQPVKTMFGHHLIKMLDRIPTRGEVNFAHILAKFDQEKPGDTAAAYAKITAVMDSLKQGIDFTELARRNSDDPQSGANGGDLGWGGRRRFVPEFEETAYALKSGQISGIVKTQFGYHIIKMLGERPPKTFDEVKQELKDIYRRYAYTNDNIAFVDSIKKSYSFAIQSSTLDKLIPLLDTTTTTSAAGWYNKLTDDIKALPIITMTNKKIDVGEMVKIIERTKELQSTSLRRLTFENVILSKIGEDQALRKATENLEQRYLEFAELMQEYREGVLLFRAEQDAVWNKVSVDSVSLKAYWKDRKADYRWPDRVRFSEIFITSDSLSNIMRDSLTAGIPFDVLAGRQTQRTGYKAKNGDWGFQPEDANDLSRKAMKLKVGDVEGPFKFQYGYSIIKATAKDPAREKTFDEAYSEVSSKFQEYESKRLESEWIQSLRNKFGVTENKTVLSNAFATLKQNK